MRPAAMDTDIADDIVHQERLVQYVAATPLVWAVGDGVAIRRADLAAMSYVARIRRADLDGVRLGIVVILTTATRDSATERDHCACYFSTAGGGVSDGDVVRRADADVGRRGVHFRANHYRVVRGRRAR